MHSEYLRDLFLNNLLSDGKFMVDGKPIALNDIKVPVFAVGTQKDHISPWKSVFKVHLFLDTDITFVLTSGGHNSGIVSEHGHPRRSFQISTHKKSSKQPSPDEWQMKTPHHKGSWWPAWEKWLVEHSLEKRLPPPMGSPKKGYKVLRNAPGVYVLKRT